MNPTTLSNVIDNGFAPIKYFYEMSKTKRFSYDFTFNEILSK